ncbi:MAG: zinc-binding dehydrogenase [Chloroflexota bacterium]
MKALVKFAPGDGNIEIQDIPEPSAAPGQVKIKVEATGICGTDLHIWHNEFRSWPPVVLGHEIAGEVADVGEGVQRVKPGDRVTTETYFTMCEHCQFCRSGRHNLCPERRSIGSGVNGGFTNFVVVPERNVHVLPESVSLLGGALTEPLACVVRGVLELPRLRAGDIAVIAGPGAIGLLALQVVVATGASAVVLGTDADQHRLRLALDLGAFIALNVDHDPVQNTINEVSDGQGADIVYECSGAGRAALTLLELVRRGGQYAQIGLFGKPVAWNLDAVCLKELSVTGSNATVPSSWDRALSLLASGAVRTEPLISGDYPITEWREAFDIFERRAGLKTVLRPVQEGAA